MNWLYTTWYGILLLCVIFLIVILVFSIVFYKHFFKRFYDILLSGTAIIILSPVFILLIIIGTIKMKGNPFFVQLRPGKKDKTGNERIFKLIKFRTMTNEKDEKGDLLPDEKRLVSYGKFLRSTSLDELPELFNIFIGDMSIVGPRPQLVRDLVFMSEEQKNRHNVRQGLTGLAQINGRNQISWEEKINYDIKYVNNISLLGDVKILINTVFSVLKREGISEEGNDTATDFGVYLLNNNKITQEDFDMKMEEAKRIVELNNE